MLQTDLESFNSGGQSYSIKVAAIDTTDDGTTNYDTFAIFDANHGSILGSFTQHCSARVRLTTSRA